MNKLFLIVILFCLVGASKAQSIPSEPNVYRTYDTLFTVALGPWTATTVWARVSIPVGYFSSDTTSRPAIIWADGDGEQGTDSTKLLLYGPHYWLSHGWNGGNTLGNGIHFPIYITIQPTALNAVLGGLFTEPFMKILYNLYHPRGGYFHVGGLSHGATLWGDLVAYAGTPGDTWPMQHIRSYCAMQSGGGGPDGNQGAYNVANPFGVWAKSFGGKYFGLEGTSDYRQTWLAADSMNAAVPNSGYEVMENDGGGAHCCWADFTNPATQWQNKTAPYGNPWIVTSQYSASGNYIGTGNLWSWMLRNGDTTLIGQSVSVNKPPVALITNPVDTLTQPVDSIRLTCTNSYDPDGKIVSYSWKQMAGPVAAVLSKNPDSSITVSHLANGPYSFQLTVTDNNGASSSTSATVVERFVPVVCPVCPPPIVCPAPRTVTAFSLSLTNGVIVTTIQFSDGSTGSVTP